MEQVPRHSKSSLGRRRFLATLAGGVAVLNHRMTRGAEVESPITGSANKDLQVYDEFMSAFIAEHKVPGASLAVTKDSKLVYARGFGFADVEKSVPVEPTSLFRIASVSKPLTATAILRLVQNGKLSLDDRVVDRMGLNPVLNDGQFADARWNDITIRHCLQHTAGWDRTKSGDPIGIPREIAKALNSEPPATPSQVVQFAMSQKLDFNPGEKYEYSNVGYLVLGRIIEAVTGEAYESYVRKEILAPLDVTAPRLGKALPENRAEGEVSYYDSMKRTGPCLYAPKQGQIVPVQDGVDNLEGYEAHGGWIASAVDLAKFLSAFDNPAKSRILSPETMTAMLARPQGPPGLEENGQPKEVWYGCGWLVRPVGNTGTANIWHGGFIAGTEALVVRRHDGLNWTVLFNTAQNPKGESLQGLIDSKLHEVAAQVRKWPRGDQFRKYLKG